MAGVAVFVFGHGARGLVRYSRHEILRFEESRRMVTMSATPATTEEGSPVLRMTDGA